MPHIGPPLNSPVTLPDGILAAGLAEKPDEVALVSATGSWTWRELEDASNRLATNLLGHGLKKGDRVASLMPNRDMLFIHYLACLKAGLVAVPLNYRYMAPHIDHALEVSEAAVLLAHAERDDDLAASEFIDRLPLGRITYGARDRSGPSLEALIEQQPDHAELAPPGPADPAAIFFTSGSTGSPKGVTHSYKSLGAMYGSARSGLELTADDVVLPASSISHLGGFLFSFSTLAAGAGLVLTHTFDGGAVLPLLRAHRPTVLCMLPAALMTLVRDHGAKHDDFTSLRLCRAGGDKVPAELEKEFTELVGMPIDEGYGMTEVGLAAVNPPSGEIKLGSVGRPIPGFAFSIRDEDGSELGPDEEGRLWMQTGSATVGYWNRPEATEELYRDGWLDSGDVMKADENGYIWFCGRKKQIIVHDGSNICPQEVEEALLDHESVEIAGVVGIHDLVHGENVRAYVAFREGAARPGNHELILFARERIGYKAPEEIIVLDEMPLNPTGKVDRVTLKKMAEQLHAPET